MMLVVIKLSIFKTELLILIMKSILLSCTDVMPMEMKKLTNVNFLIVFFMLKIFLKSNNVHMLQKSGVLAHILVDVMTSILVMKLKTGLLNKWLI